MVYELFKPGVIGKDLFNSLLMLCNEVKIQQKIPRFLKYTDITSFYKSKGDRRSLENDRGVYGVMKVRSIKRSHKEENKWGRAVPSSDKALLASQFIPVFF